MTQSRSVCSRIRNARASLDNAERSFRSNQEARGELDLMLAEAELDNLRQKRPGISWTRHTLAACFAVLVLASGDRQLQIKKKVRQAQIRNYLFPNKIK